MTQWGLDTLFNPSKRHMDEEKQRLQATREEVGDNSGGERIDISTGKVVIKVADAGDPPASETETDSADPPAEDTSTPAGRARQRRAALRRKEQGSV